MTRFFNLSDDFLAKFRSLEEALWLLEARLTSRVDSEPIEPRLGQVWASERPAISVPDAAAVAGVVGESQLTGESLGFPIGLGAVEGATLNGANSAYVSATRDDEERIILSLDWLQTATTKEIEETLLAQLGQLRQQRFSNELQVDGLPLKDSRSSEFFYRQGQNPLNQSLLDLVSESQTRPAIAAAQSTSSVDLDAINPLYHFGACGCPVCNGSARTAEANQAATTLGGTATSAPAAAVSLQSLANYLTTGFWQESATFTRKYNLTNSGTGAKNGTITYNVSGWANDINGLSLDRRQLAREVFKTYSATLGINFQEVTGSGGSIRFTDNDTGAYAYAATGWYTDASQTAVIIDYSVVNINSAWYDGKSNYSTYTPQTFFHEIGHALGLGHQGLYNYTGTTLSYGTSAQFANDSWQESMMSYWDQTQNPTTGASFAWLHTPQVVDLISFDQIYANQGYSTSKSFLGDTVYGNGTTISASTSQIWNLFSTYASTTAYAITDGGGYDTLDVSNFSANQLINLAPSRLDSTIPSLSNIAGKIGNVSIAVGTIIEAAKGGSGADSFYGNIAANTFWGNGGNDSFYDSTGSDTYYGGSGFDSLVFTDSIDLFSIAYNPVTSFLSIGKLGAGDVDLAFGDIESISFNGSAYAFSSFADSVSPTLVSSTPADDAQSVALASNISLVFSENVQAGVGNFVLSNGVDIRSISVSDASQVIFAGANVTINPLADLVAGSSYSLQFASGVIRDGSGNSFAGITNSTSLNFTTVALPQLSIVGSAAIKDEGNSGGTAYTFTVSRDGDLSAGSTANWSVSGTGTNAATASDFSGGLIPSGIVTFAAGVASEVITVLVAGDSVVENDEEFAVTLSTPTNATIATAVASGTISNDDVPPPPPPVLSIAASDATKAEGTGGGTAYTFTVSRDGDLSASSTANWSVSGTGTNAATASDFSGGLLPSGIVTFAAGVASEVITVLVAGDSVVENDEEFAVTLSTPTNATIGTAVASGTISNDDVPPPPPPVLSIAASDATKAEGTSGGTAYTFTVSRDGDLSAGSSANWSVSGTGTNAATASDFSGGLFPSGIVTFAAGVASEVITVLVAGDSVVENDEEFAVTLSTPTNATIGTAVASGTISNDDVPPPPPPVLSIAASDATKAEGTSGGTAYTFTVTRSGDLSSTSIVAWAVTGSGVNAASTNDFVGNTFPSDTLTFAIGESIKTITVNVNGDSTVEFDEGFTVSLSNASNATITTASASGTIRNDDTAAPVVTQVSTSPSDGVLAIGETVRLTVAFSSDVFVTGIPALNLANGGVATYASGSGTTSLNFTYVVNASNTSTADLTTASSNAIGLPGGAAISNLLGTAAVLGGANAVNPAGILAVDTTLPGVTSMAVNGNTVILSFSEVVKGANLIAANFSRQIGTAAAVSASAISLDSLSNKVTLTFTGTAPLSTSAVKVTYAAISGNTTSGLITDQAGNPLTVFSNKVVDTYQSAVTVSTLGDGVTIAPATSFTNLVLTGTSAVNGSGNAFANTITGNSAVNVLNGNAGVDLIDGSGAGDLYLVSSSTDHGAAEFSDSGLTGIDEVRFTSVTAGQTLTLFAGDAGLETVVIGTGSALAAVTTGTTALSIDASAAPNGLTITGNAGANRLTGTAYADILNGNAGNDTISGLAGADAITGGAGLDVLSGGADADSFIYTTLSDGVVGGTSTARTFELITDFQVGLDRIDAPGTAVRTVKVLGAVTALTDTAIGSLLNASSGGTVNFAANGASTFTFGTGATMRTFLAINNATAAYSTAADPIIEITGFSYFNGATSLSSLSIS